MPKLLVGLGNPGERYANTRHNVGWTVLDAFARNHGVVVDRAGHHGTYGESRWVLTGEKVILLKPLTFMNLSGRSVVSMATFFRVTPAEILVICDDIDLVPGRLRMREKGGSGGHNGVKSIIQELGTQEFPRLRVGVGRPAPGWKSADWVLAPFGADDSVSVQQVLPTAVEAIEFFLSEGIIKAMTRYNG